MAHHDGSYGPDQTGVKGAEALDFAMQRGYLGLGFDRVQDARAWGNFRSLLNENPAHAETIRVWEDGDFKMSESFPEPSKNQNHAEMMENMVRTPVSDNTIPIKRSTCIVVRKSPPKTSITGINSILFRGSVLVLGKARTGNVNR